MSGTMNPMATDVDQQELAQRLLAQSGEQDFNLVGPDRFLNGCRRTFWRPLWKRRWTNTSATRKHDVSGRQRLGGIAAFIDAARRGGECPQRHPPEDGADRDRAR